MKKKFLCMVLGLTLLSASMLNAEIAFADEQEEYDEDLVDMVPVAEYDEQENDSGEDTDSEEDNLGAYNGSIFVTNGGSDEVLSEAKTLPDNCVGTPPVICLTNWKFILANPDHSIDDYTPEVEEVEGVYLDKRIVDDFQQMIEDCAAACDEVYPSSGYRDYETQQSLFQRKLDQGYSEEEAATIVAIPGTSEHQTGLACDISDYAREILNPEEIEQTETAQWLMAHCAEYGFILRFPKDKSDITGIIYESWHFRYVGKEAAKFITDNNLCLEEFLALYE